MQKCKRSSKIGTTYDRREIMTQAWADTRYQMKAFLYAPHQLRQVFASALRNVWVKAKALAALLSRSPASLRAELADMENRDTLGHAGFARMDELRNALRTVEAREAEEAEAADFATKRDLIASAKGRICAVTFTKKDGSQRVMKVQPAALKFHVKGDDAIDAGRKAAATRAIRHPNLLPVWDAEIKAPRSVNLATVTRIAVGGQVHLFTA